MADRNPDDFRPLMGWLDHPLQRSRLAGTLPHRTLSAANPALLSQPPLDNIFLYKAWKDVLGSYPDYPAQQIEDCTSFGAGHAIDLLQCVEISHSGSNIEYEEVCTECLYGLGREVGGLLRDDAGGGYGVAVAKAAAVLGMVPRSLVGPYSGSRAKEWGYSGVPFQIKQNASQFKIGAITLVTTVAELDAALGNLYPCAGGFREGFTMTRDVRGVCHREGKWGHEMACVAKRTPPPETNGTQRLPEYLLIQSWGPDTPDGPTTDDQPSWSFWVTQGDMSDILSHKDFMTFSSFGGFRARSVPVAWTNSGWGG
jgi:hypothetical protein